MNKRLILTALLLIVAVYIHVSPVSAVPPTPSSFWGTVKLDGANAPMDTAVTAYINGTQYVSTVVQLFNGDTVYSFNVPGDDSSTPGVIEGGVSGDTIRFYLAGHPADQTAPWLGGTNVELNLTSTTTACELTVAVDPIGGGITDPPVGVHVYEVNTEVTVTATAVAGYMFDYWSGACTGSGECVVTMDGNRIVIAHFKKLPYTSFLPVVAK